MQSIFGTDGIRGVFGTEITYSLAFKVGYAFGVNLQNKNPVIIGRDTRISGDLLFEAISSGLNAAGIEVFNLGICPTPAIPFLIRKENFSSGIMISASHNPPKYNGIKIFDNNGEKITNDCENLIQKVMEETNENICFSKKNKAININNNLLNIYTKSLTESMGGENLEGIRIILDTCFGSATTCAESVFKELGAEVKVINNEKDGLKINLNCGSTCLTPLKKAVLENNADMGFSFDGDADRVIGIDSVGGVLDGDHILFLWGRELIKEKILPNNTIITTEMANLGFEKEWNNLGGILYRTAVGDKFIYKALKEKKGILGGEQSGHILSNINNFSGDGILTSLQIARYCKKKKINLQTWLNSSFSPYPQKLTNINLNFEFKKINQSLKDSINESIEYFTNMYTEPCRIFVRPSGTEPVLRILVEAQDKIEVDSLSKKITSEINFLINKISK